MKLRCFFTLFLLTTTICATRAAESADATFAQAAQLADNDLTRSRELYRVAALRYLDEARANPAESGPLLYNAGNAFFLAGDNGRAVVAYRRAQQVMPGSPLLRDNLEFVRKQSGNSPEIAPSARLAWLRFWHWTPAAQWLLLVGAWLLFWAGWFWRQWSDRRYPIPIWLGTLAVAALMAGTLFVQHRQAAQRCRGVIIASQAEARKGPNYGYAPAFTATLDSGLEGDVIGQQNDWLHLWLSPDRECWVRRSAVAIWQGQAPNSH